MHIDSGTLMPFRLVAFANKGNKMPQIALGLGFKGTLMPILRVAQFVPPALPPLAISMVTIESTDFCLARHRPNVEPNKD
nr:hypothetical protein [Pseudomonas sp. HS-2]